MYTPQKKKNAKIKNQSTILKNLKPIVIKISEKKDIKEGNPVFKITPKNQNKQKMGTKTIIPFSKKTLRELKTP